MVYELAWWKTMC